LGGCGLAGSLLRLTPGSPHQHGPEHQGGQGDGPDSEDQGATGSSKRSSSM
jgi:hypothetical protein